MSKKVHEISKKDLKKMGVTPEQFLQGIKRLEDAGHIKTNDKGEIRPSDSLKDYLDQWGD